uniref:Cyclin N-terminal domain-containing protein n=1 Tax=Steinernema glaseri TaxID=37863 RepID=A0A1I7YYC8_9BILA
MKHSNIPIHLLCSRSVLIVAGPTTPQPESLQPHPLESLEVCVRGDHMAERTIFGFSDFLNVQPFPNKLLLDQDSALLCGEKLEQSPPSTSGQSSQSSSSASSTRSREPLGERRRSRNAGLRESTFQNAGLTMRHQPMHAHTHDKYLEKKLNNPTYLSVMPEIDKTVHGDARCLEAMLFSEKFTKPRPDYFEKVQTEMTRVIRRKAASWLYEVCQEEKCEPSVYPLAMSYFDRFCSNHNVRKQDVQLVATTCLFLASKILAPVPIAANQLVYYTDGAVTVDQLMNWEMLTVGKLDWNLSTTTAMEFFDQFVYREPDMGRVDRQFCNCVHQLQKNVELATLLPSHQAALALLYVSVGEPSTFVVKANNVAFNSTSLDKKMLNYYMSVIDRILQKDFSDEEVQETVSAEIIFEDEIEIEKEESKTKVVPTKVSSRFDLRYVTFCFSVLVAQTALLLRDVPPAAPLPIGRVPECSAPQRRKDAAPLHSKRLSASHRSQTEVSFPAATTRASAPLSRLRNF